MKIFRIPVGLYAANCYIVVDESTSRGIVIDPGGNVDDLIKFIEKEDFKIEYIVLTHGHADHIGGLIELKESLDLPIIAHVDEVELLSDSEINLSAQMCPREIEISPTILVNDGDKFKFGNIEVGIIHTPGHTKGGMCLKIEDELFSGDTLFKGSIGRGDLYGGDSEVLIDSILNKLLILDDNTKVWPGHGEATTIGKEKIFNPYLN